MTEISPLACMLLSKAKKKTKELRILDNNILPPTQADLQALDYLSWHMRQPTETL